MTDGHIQPSRRIEADRPPPQHAFIRGDDHPPDSAGALLPPGPPSRPMMTARQLSHQPITAFFDSTTVQKEMIQFTNGVYKGRAALRHLQSYKYTDNSCFIDCGLELWFRAYVLWSYDEREAFVKFGVPKTSVLWTVFNNYRNRLRWILAPQKAAVSLEGTSKKSKKKGAGRPGKGKGKEREEWPIAEDNITEAFELLKTAQSAVRNVLSSRLGLYKEGERGNALRWMIEVINVRSLSHAAMYTLCWLTN